MEFYYLDKNILDNAWTTIDNKKSFIIKVTGWRVRILKKSMAMYMKYFYEKECHNEKKKISEILKFAPFGMFTPTLWGIINHALLAGMAIEYYEKGDTLSISFHSSSCDSLHL